MLFEAWGGIMAGPQLENIPWWKKYFKGEQTYVWETGQKYTIYNK